MGEGEERGRPQKDADGTGGHLHTEEAAEVRADRTRLGRATAADSAPTGPTETRATPDTPGSGWRGGHRTRHGTKGQGREVR